jgi:hypothetical protein
MVILRLLDIGYRSLIPIAEAVYYCPIPGFPCPTGGSYFADYLGKIAIGIGGSIVGIITGVLIFYSIKLAIGGSEESNVTEVRTAYLHVIFGAVLIAGASFIAAIVLPSTGPASALGANPGSFITNVIIPMKKFFFGMMAAALIINIGYHGAQLIVSQDDSGMTNARQGMLRGAIGLTIVMISGTVLDAFNTNIITDTNNELFGIGNFIITIFGALAVVAIVVAAIMLVVSVDEQLKDRAKKIMITVAISVLVVMSSKIIISTFF